MSNSFPRSTSGGISTPRKKSSSSSTKPKGGVINIIEPKAKKHGSMSIKVSVDKVVVADPKAAGLPVVNRPGSTRYRKNSKE